MRSIKDLIARLPIPGLKESADRHHIAAVISQSCGVSISPRSVQVREGVVSVTVPPVLKSAITLRKSEIVATLRDAGTVVHDIR